MAYHRPHRPDIRAINLVHFTAEPVANAPSIRPSLVPAATPPPVGRDVRTILSLFLPLVAALLIAYRLDGTRHWVVRLAEWLMRRAL